MTGEAMGEKNLRYVDMSKGLAMIFVVFYHVYSYTEKALDPLLLSISTLHDSTFFMSSGVLFFGTMQRAKERGNSKLDTLIKKGIGLLVPFINWSLIYGVGVWMVGRLINSGGGIVFLDCLKDSVSRLWFLPVLFIVFVFLSFFSGMLKLWIVIFFLGMGGLYSTIFTKIMFFFLIAKLGFMWNTMEMQNKKKLYIACGAMWSILNLILFWNGMIGTEDAYYPGYKLILILFIYILGGVVIMGSADFYCSAMPVKKENILCIIGQNSIYIYILHCVFMYFLQFAGVKQWYFYTIIGLLAVVMPILIAKSIKNKRIDALLFHPVKLIQGIKKVN